MITKIFQDYQKAKEYIWDQGFIFFKERFINMGEGYEHIFVSEYPHKYENKVCRMADLRWEQYKIQPGDTVPRIIGFIQVSIKDI